MCVCQQTGNDQAGRLPSGTASPDLGSHRALPHTLQTACLLHDSARLLSGTAAAAVTPVGRRAAAELSARPCVLQIVLILTPSAAAVAVWRDRPPSAAAVAAPPLLLRLFEPPDQLHAAPAPLAHVHLGLLADQVGEAAANTADGCDGIHHLLLAINVGVQHTQNVLEVISGNEGLWVSNNTNTNTEGSQDRAGQRGSSNHIHQ